MSTDASPVLTVVELQKRLTAVEPGALLVHPRVLRRIIKEDRRILVRGLQVPHRKTFVIDRDKALQFAERDELGLDTSADLPDSLLLLARPFEDWLETHSHDETLIKYWRLLFHARIDQETNGQIARGELNQRRVWSYVARLGSVEFQESAAVLRQEGFLLPPVNRVRTFAELVAVHCELKHFARPLLEQYFPALEEQEKIDALMGEVVDAEALLRQTRLEGARDPVVRKPFTEAEPNLLLTQTIPALPASPSAKRCQRLRDDADAAFATGNVVRAAVLFAQAAQIAPIEQHEQVCSQAASALESLAYRLQAALQLHDRETEEWRALLPALLESASRGGWSVSARLLYDLQKVCVDHERDVYKLDLLGSIVSLGRRPVKRLLPHYANVLLVKHLRSAHKRLPRTPVNDEVRRRLSILLRTAVRHSEDRLRARIRPILEQVLDEVELVPTNPPEQIARGKLIEELLDRITEWGFLTMGDVRDAISRNQVKLPDLKGPVELIRGDPLLIANSKLSVRLEGVYRRGEIYLRLLQRFSALAFGTRLGRWLTLAAAIPVGGAVAAVVFVYEMLHLVGITHRDPMKQIEALPTTSAVATVGLATLLLLLIHWGGFRHACMIFLHWIGRALRTVLWDWPRQFFELSWVSSFLRHPIVVRFGQFFVKPMIPAGVVLLVTLLLGAGMEFALWASGVTYVLSVIFLRSRFGRDLDEAIEDWFMRNWYWIRDDLAPGLLRMIASAFKFGMDLLERMLYSVDEWLRFRAGDSKLSLVFKPILGLFWSIITWTVRFVINLFVEPTFNPIKHFPTVTVAAKLMVPLLFVIGNFFTHEVNPALSSAFSRVIGPDAGLVVGTALGSLIGGFLVIFLPGLAGFAVWEFKENWKLYRANRAEQLRPAVIGSHGETMKRLLKVGFHSGTLPKTYARLRKADRQVNARAFFKHHEKLEHEMAAVKHFIERELIALLEQSKRWGDVPVHVGVIRACTNRVHVELCSSTHGAGGAWLAFELHSAWVVAGFTDAGWLGQLSPEQGAVLHNALAGLYKLAGVDLVHEQLQSKVPEDSPLYYLLPDHLLVWMRDDFTKAVVHPLREVAEATAEPDAAPATEHKLSLEEINYSLSVARWSRWVDVWVKDQANETPTELLAPSFRLLPRGVPAAAALTAACGLAEQEC